jgi:hypothetical protein
VSAAHLLVFEYLSTVVLSNSISHFLASFDLDVDGQGSKGQDCWQSAVCKEEMTAEGVHYAEFTLLSGTGDSCFGVVKSEIDPKSSHPGFRALAKGWMYNCKRGCWVYHGQDIPMRDGHYKPMVCIHLYLSVTRIGFDLSCDWLSQVDTSGRPLPKKVGVGQTLGILLRRGELIAYRNGKLLGALCQGQHTNVATGAVVSPYVTGDLVWAAGMYDTGGSARIERRPLPDAQLAS